MLNEVSSFDVRNKQSTAGKIIVALERISEAFRVLIWDESKETGLSPIQIQILIFMLFHEKDKCNVSYLAFEFNMTKATISDSVKVLLQKGLIKKDVNPTDSRSFAIVLTETGETVAKKASMFANRLEKPFQELTLLQQENFLIILLETIEKLNKAGIITVQRMCSSCRFYKKNEESHFCNLINKTLSSAEIQVDCPEHQKL